MPLLFIILYILLLLFTIAIFLFSSVVTLSDGQGALIFGITIPVIAILLIIAWFMARSLKKNQKTNLPLEKIPVAFAVILILFFAMSFIPTLNKIPSEYLRIVSILFETTTGKTPYLYFRERKSFIRLLSNVLEDQNKMEIDFSLLDVSFAWDKVCVLGPYTNNQQAKNILNLDFNIENRSEVHNSDSITALVFIFENKVNQVVDLRRDIADFNKYEFCIEKDKSKFRLLSDSNKRRILELSK